jgi:hypothetical protein
MNINFLEDKKPKFLNKNYKLDGPYEYRWREEEDEQKLEKTRKCYILMGFNSKIFVLFLPAFKANTKDFFIEYDNQHILAKEYLDKKTGLTYFKDYGRENYIGF